MDVIEWASKIPVHDLSDGRGLCRVIFAEDFLNALKELQSAQPEKTQLSEEDATSDCISRQDAIIALKDNVIEIGGDDFTEKGVHEDDIDTIIGKLPSVHPDLAQLLAYECGKVSAQPEQRWISCNERMPETTGYYLIQYSRRICQDEMAVAFYSVEEAELDKNYTWEFKPFADLKEVIAWMPLPKPYKEEGKNAAD